MAAVPVVARTESSEDDCRVSADRISNLPPEVTDRILQFLPLEDAVRMSILSTYWRYKWALLPQLTIDPDFICTIIKRRRNGEVLPDDFFDDSNWDDDMSARLRVVDNVLLRHFGPIQKFVLRIPLWFPEDADVSHWIQFVSGKFVQEFTLVEEWEGICLREERKPPSSMFASEGFNHLTHLTLIECRLPSLPTTFKGFPCLVHLKLRTGFTPASKGEANKITILVSKCSMLESLNLDIYEAESSLSIHAPKLETLVLSGHLSNIRLEETKRIKTLSLDIKLHQKRDRVMGFFTCLPHVEKLVLDGKFWETFWSWKGGPIPKLMLFSELGQLKSLVLDGIGCSHRRAPISFVLFLLQVAPKLQNLEISVHSDTYQPFSNTIVEEECCFYQLKTVKLKLTRHISVNVLQLIKLILSSSPVLEVMTFQANKLQLEEKFDIAKELLQCCRASTNAKIIFKT